MPPQAAEMSCYSAAKEIMPRRADYLVELSAVVDGLKGFPEAIAAVFPPTIVQTCIVRRISTPASGAVDQAGWHLSGGLNVPSNITLIPMPAKCPELNPQENIWQFMRENWLSNRIFESYQQIVDHCCHAWNKLINQPWRIMSIGMREWAYQF
jgi:Transposase, Mutator family